MASGAWSGMEGECSLRWLGTGFRAPSITAWVGWAGCLVLSPSGLPETGDRSGACEDAWLSQALPWARSRSRPSGRRLCVYGPGGQELTSGHGRLVWAPWGAGHILGGGGLSFLLHQIPAPRRRSRVRQGRAQPCRQPWLQASGGDRSFLLSPDMGHFLEDCQDILSSS